MSSSSIAHDVMLLNEEGSVLRAMGCTGDDDQLGKYGLGECGQYLVWSSCIQGRGRRLDAAAAMSAIAAVAVARSGEEGGVDWV